jgi:hypothetical protein
LFAETISKRDIKQRTDHRKHRDTYFDNTEQRPAAYLTRTTDAIPLTTILDQRSSYTRNYQPTQQHRAVAWSIPQVRHQAVSIKRKNSVTGYQNSQSLHLQSRTSGQNNIHDPVRACQTQAKYTVYHTGRRHDIYIRAINRIVRVHIYLTVLVESISNTR